MPKMMQIKQLRGVLGKVFVALFCVAGMGNFRVFAQQPQKTRQFPVGALNRSEDLPPGRFRDRLERLPAEKRDRAVRWLRSFHFTEYDLQSLEIDSEGGVFYVDPPADLPAVQSTEPV